MQHARQKLFMRMANWQNTFIQGKYRYVPGLGSGRFCTRLRLLCGLGLRDGDLQKGLNVQLAMMSVVLVSLCPIYPIFSISKNTFLAPFSQPAQVYTAGCCRDGLFAIELVTLRGAPELE